jgi:CAAX protease family protein
MKVENQKIYSLKKIIKLPISRIILGGLFSILIPVLVNKLVLDNLFQMFGFSDNLNRAVRVFITTIFLMPLLYYFLFSRLENRKITELKLRNAGISIIMNFFLSVAIISISFISLILMGFIKITVVQFPEFIIANTILILGFVITEEIFFRGIFYRIIETTWGTKIAIISSALVFSVLHLGNENTSIMSFISVVAGGVVLGILYTYTKNLLVPIAFHFGWNLTQVILGFGLSGGDEFSKSYVFKWNLSGLDIITGEASGIENSIIPVSILIVVFIVLYKKSNESNKIILVKRKRIN